MKLTLKACLLLLFSIALFSCSDDNLDLKDSIQPNQDEISIVTDTMHLSASSFAVTSIPAKITTDTFLLGSYKDDIYGRTTAELLAQFNCPSGLTVPDTITGDSLVLKLVYTGYQAKGDSTLNIKIYRMKNTLSYSGTYYSNITPEYDEADLLATASYSKLSSSGTILIKLDTALKNEFINAGRNNTSVFSNETKFVEFFKGLYVAVESSSSSILTLSTIDVLLNYKYTNAGGTIISQSNTFPANKEVRQVNRIVHDGDIPSTAGEIFVSSPAGIHSNVDIPISRIRDSLHIKVQNGIAYLNSTTRKLSVNSALLTFEVADTSTIDYPPYLLLIKKSAVTSFFSTSTTPDSKTAVLAAYSSTNKSYTFSLKTYLANELKSETSIGDDPMVLIPVMVSYDSNGYVSAVKYDAKLHAVALKGPTSLSPLKLDLVVSGF